MVNYHKDDEDDNGYEKTSSKIKAEEARSFKDQKGKGYLILPFFFLKCILKIVQKN